MSDPVVFCETDVTLCDVLDITQILVFPEPDRPRLITLLGEKHAQGQEYEDDDYSTRSSPGEFSITDYVMNTLQTNPRSVVVVEQPPNATMDEIRSIDTSSTLREVPYQVTRAGFQNRMVYVDWRKIICPQPRLITLVSRYNLFDFFKQSYMSPQELDQVMYSLTCLKTFVRETQKMPDLPPSSQAVLDEMEEAIKEHFGFAQPGVEEYKARYANKTLTDKWVATEVADPLRTAWSLVMDYFTIREAFKPGPANEIVVVAGAAHTTMTASFLMSGVGSKMIKEVTGDWSPGAKSCIPLYATVAVNPASCERLASFRQPKPVYSAVRHPQRIANRSMSPLY